MKSCSVTKQQQKEAITKEKARLAELATLGHDVDNAMTALLEIESKLGDNAAMRKIANKYENESYLDNTTEPLRGGEIVELPLVNRVHKQGRKNVRESLRVEKRIMLDNGDSKIIYYTAGKRKRTAVEIDKSGYVKGENATGRWSIQGLSKLGQSFGSKKEQVKKTDSHIELKNSIWNNSKEALGLFDILADIDGNKDAKHTKYLRDLLSTISDETAPIMNKFKVFINKNASENRGTVTIKNSGSEMILDINENSNALNGEMSAIETYMHEMIHMSVEMARAYKRGPLANVIDEMNTLYMQARKEITWQQLVVNNDAEGKKAAQAQWNHMFNNNNGLSEFIALGMTNEKVREALGGFEAKNTKIAVKGDSMWSKISYEIVRLYSAIRDLIKLDNHGEFGDERLLWLSNQMWMQNSMAIDNNSLSSKITAKAEQARAKVDDTVKDIMFGTKKIIDSTLDTVMEANKDNVLGQMLSVGKGTVELVNPYMTKNKVSARNKTMTGLSKAMDGHKNWLGLGGILAPEGTVMSMINYLSDDDDLTQRVEKYGLMNQRLDSNRTDTITSVGGMIKNKLGKSTDKPTQKALTDVLIRTDMQSISNEYTIEEIGEIIGSDKKLDEAIENERAKLDKLVWNKKLQNYIKSQTMGLGHYLATGESGSSVQKNATSILYMTGMRDAASEASINLPAETKTKIEAVKVIDRLATLEGLKRTSKTKRELARKMIKHNPDGAEAVIGTHRVYVTDSNKFALDHKTGVFGVKGEIKDTKELQMQSMVGKDDKKTQAKMKKKGYKIKEETAVSGLWLYTSSISGTAKYDKQAVAMISEGKRLHNMLGVINQSGDDGTDVHGELVRQVKSEAIANSKAQMEEIIQPDIDGYSAMFNKDGVTNYGVSINNTVYENHMKQDNKAPILLGKMIAEINEKEEAIKLNHQVYKTILDDMKNYDRGSVDSKNEYIEVGPDAKTQGLTAELFSKELLNNMPYNIKKKILARKNGQQFIAVRRDLAMMYFGSRSPSVLEMKIPFMKGATVRDQLNKTKGGEVVANIVSLAGEVWVEMVSIQKVDIVMKTPMVLINNIISNTNYMIALGILPWEAMKVQADMFKSTKKYMDSKKELDKLMIEVRISGKWDADKKREARLRMKELKQVMKSSPVHDLMEAGLFTSIIEDINDKDLTTNNRLENLIESNKITKGIKDNTPKMIKDGLNVLYMTEDTGLFRTMMMATQYSDFVARASRYHYLMEKGVSKKQALKTILDDFVNYNRIDSKLIRWVNEMGFAWFTKYFFGANKSLIRVLRDRPTSVLGMSMLGMANPTDALAWNKDFSYSINGPFDTAIDGTINHIMPASTLEIFGLM